MALQVYHARVTRIMYDRTEEVIFDDIFSSKKSAIRAAQEHYDKQPLNGYVYGVWAVVYAKHISSNGMGCDINKLGCIKKCFNICKKL